MLEIEKKESKNLKNLFFRNYSSRLARIPSTVRTGRAGVVEEIYTYQKTDEQELGIYLEILVPYQNNRSEEVIFGSNKIKEEHETMKLQNEEVMLKNFSNLD